jgi:hypothetical protein
MPKPEGLIPSGNGIEDTLALEELLHGVDGKASGFARSSSRTYDTSGARAGDEAQLFGMGPL